MKRFSRVGSVGAIVLALSVFCSEAASAQSWQWQSVVHSPDQGTVATESRVVLSPRDVAITYSANVGSRSVPITSCRAELSDIGNVHSVDNGGKLFMFIVLKPQHSASCNSGSQAIAVLPIGRDASATSAIATIMRACCRVAAGPAVVAQAPRPTPTPTPTPAATSAPQSISPVDWVENAGLFAFVRLLNKDSRPVVISAGQVLDCRDVASGCGAFIDRPVTVAPGHVVTLATVTSNNPANAPAFSYRYEVQTEHGRVTGSGLSAKRATDPATVMSAQDVRAAEALAIGQMRTQQSASTSAPAPPANMPPRLVERGSTRLGVGQKGVALVRVGVGRDGSAQYATIISISNRALTAAALETAVSTKFSPAMKNGIPTDGNYVATFQFDGEDPALSSIPVWRRAPSSSPAAAASPNLSAVAVPTPLPSPKPSPTPSASPSPRPSPTPSPSPVSAPSPRASTP
jgi:hypothetical protein